MGDYYTEFYGKSGKKQEQPWMSDYKMEIVRHGEDVKDGAPGGHEDVIAAAKKLNINVLVYDSKKDLWMCMSPKTARKEDIEKVVGGREGGGGKGYCSHSQTQDERIMGVSIRHWLLLRSHKKHFDIVLTQKSS